MEYKQKIIEMIEETNTPRFLKMIYGFVSTIHREGVQNGKSKEHNAVD